ncbi:glycosyltransferase [Roseovarius sp. LXJ103]|uniref:nucleotide disphospho-sugar-binding domain-containing protein n=1 Tax=Roseovarius carneus TaxID=2853164 RepID=UPI000D622AA5|nr:glycosyltransferase [Roseovarius carneus]MBZ8117409.1 glycosyltransferase [Roseovarius carneus]PWE36781.1 glycosyl transferase family 1 [Pelagicola sp. LXJ1103]
MSPPPVIAFFPEASFGAALNCVGIAQELHRKGAVPVFICHAGFTGVFAQYGFKEYHLPAAATDAQTEEYWQSFLRTHLDDFNLSPLEQLPRYVAPTWEAIVDTAIDAEAGLATLLARIRPSAIVLDNVIMFPAIASAGVPWVRVISCAETELPDANVPPYLSGLSADDPGRATFEAAALTACAAPHARYNHFRAARGLKPLPPGQFLEPSPDLNLLLAPSAIRHTRAAHLPEERFVFLEGCVRDEAHFDVPALPRNQGPLIYLSFGSLGAIDTDLISRMIAAFADLPARFFVNVGDHLEAYAAVPDNVYLGSWFPQPSIVSQAALFIHHGGNNSYCEALYHGVPSLVMPYCWDGHDNAHRAVQTGTGLHMHRANWSDAELRQTVMDLAQDRKIRNRMQGMSLTMKADPGTVRAAEAILHTASCAKAPRLRETRNPPPSGQSPAPRSA